ncbi:hypothetical protein EON80_15675 [bacterium]|nr:MAG: hypothetical protein EON80_15675 [bacterium]
MMKFAAALLLSSTLWAASRADAYVIYKSPDGMISQAEAIAVVKVESVAATSAKGESLEYRQKASTKVEQKLKGDLPANFDLWGAQSFSCAGYVLEPGRYLVFLEHDKELWAGNNFQFSIRKIEGENVAWFSDKSLFESKPQPLATLLASIREQVNPPTLKLSLALGPDKDPLLWWVTLSDDPQRKFATLQDLHAHLQALPPGTSIEYDSPCRRTGGEPTQKALDAFAAICKQRNINFRVNPAG